MSSSIIMPLIGGILIGISSSLMMLLLGRVTGISGILSTSFSTFKQSEQNWRRTFIIGLILGGFLSKLVFPNLFNFEIQSSLRTIIIAGLLVGFGTSLGSGCTSGHGVCGIALLSKRSFIATLTFMLSGVITVAIMRLI